MVQNDKKIISVSLPISGTVPLLIVVFGAHVQKNDISAMFFIYSKLWFFGFLGVFYNIVNIKIFTFVIGPIQQFLIVVFQVINKSETEILRCAPPSSHMCDLFLFIFFFKFGSMVLKIKKDGGINRNLWKVLICPKMGKMDTKCCCCFFYLFILHSKLLIWKNFGSQVMGQNALGQSDCRTL